jgi:hypothetical protein
MKKIPSNNSLFNINNLSSSSKIYMSAFVNKINDEFLEDSPYNIINFVKDNLSPSEEIVEKEKIIHSSHMNYHEHTITYDMPIFFVSILIFVLYFFIHNKEFYCLSNNKTTENNHTNIINYILLAIFIIFSRNIENAI